jgi:hypothetical protein
MHSTRCHRIALVRLYAQDPGGFAERYVGLSSHEVAHHFLGGNR